MNLATKTFFIAAAAFSFIACDAGFNGDRASQRDADSGDQTTPGLTIDSGGTTIGNGGDGVICRDQRGDISSAEFLDVYEGRVVYDFSPQDIQPDETYLAYVERIIRVLADKEPYKHQNYANMLQDFTAMTRFVDDDLVNVPDHGSLPINPGCAVEQAVIQREVQLPGDRAFIINNAIWEALPELHKAALVLHEIIYKDAIPKGHTESTQVRRFNMFLLSGQVETWSEAEYQQYLTTMQLADSVVMTGELQYENPCISASHPNGCVRVYTDQMFRGGNLKYIDRPEFDNDGEEFEILETDDLGQPLALRVRIDADTWSSAIAPRGRIKLKGRMPPLGTGLVAIEWIELLED